MRFVSHVVCACVLVLCVATKNADAQSIGVRGFATFGQMTFKAKDSFQAILDTESGPIFGGGGQVLLPWGIYVEVGVWRFSDEGERVFIGPNDEVFRLGIPVTITVRPLEVTGGYRFTKSPKIVPYAGIGYSRYNYREESEFAEPGENVNENFGGFHINAGVEYLPLRWLGIGGEVGFSSIKDSIGQGGVSAAFGEDDLGGTSIRLKITVGR